VLEAVAVIGPTICSEAEQLLAASGVLCCIADFDPTCLLLGLITGIRVTRGLLLEPQFVVNALPRIIRL
jgi:hypothetical protein